jgi:hypothetical protein
MDIASNSKGLCWSIRSWSRLQIEKAGITSEPSSGSKAYIGGIRIRIDIRKEMGVERSGLKRNGAEIGAENNRYADKNGTLITTIRWRRSDDISTVIDGEAEAEVPFSRQALFSHQRTVALLRSWSRGNAIGMNKAKTRSGGCYVELDAYNCALASWTSFGGFGRTCEYTRQQIGTYVWFKKFTVSCRCGWNWKNFSCQNNKLVACNKFQATSILKIDCHSPSSIEVGANMLSGLQKQLLRDL